MDGTTLPGAVYTVLVSGCDGWWGKPWGYIESRCVVQRRQTIHVRCLPVVYVNICWWLHGCLPTASTCSIECTGYVTETASLMVRNLTGWRSQDKTYGPHSKFWPACGHIFVWCNSLPRCSIMRINLCSHPRYCGRLSWFLFSFIYFMRAINIVKVN